MKWEYKIVKLETKGLMGGKFDEQKLNNYMNQLGLEGWELATSFGTNQSFGESRYIVIIFKRTKN